MVKTDSQTTTLVKEIKKIHDLSTELSEISEDLLESQGAYSEEFLKGLKASITQEKQGKTKEIKSLSDLP